MSDHRGHGYIRTFCQEVKTLGQLHHPNICAFYGASISLPRCCIVTEHMDRGSLWSQLHGSGDTSIDFIATAAQVPPPPHIRVCRFPLPPYVVQRSSQAVAYLLPRASKFHPPTLVMQIASGLGYLHNIAGLVHRDMKTPNILVDHSGKVHISAHQLRLMPPFLLLFALLPLPFAIRMAATLL